MFIIDLKYKVPIAKIEEYLYAHSSFLDEYYANGNILMSGRKNPRTGGMIFCTLKSQEEVENLIKDDPFYLNELADYTIT